MNTASIFDSHAHSDDGQFDEDRDELLTRLHAEQNVCHIINVGADLAGCTDSIALAHRFPFIHAGVGIHPECALHLPDDYLVQLESMAQDDRVVAIGEIGLDYHYEDACPRSVQKPVFEAQIMLANRLGLPVVVHDREAHGDTMEFLRRLRPRGVVHCFSGSVEMAQETIHLGMYIGLGGAVTFKNAKTPVMVAKEIPLDRIVLETDAPYMTPVPYRGKRNDSSRILYTAAKIAEVRGISIEEVLRQTAHNAYHLFQIEE